MIERIRSLYNKIDNLFDRRSITEKIQFSREIPNQAQVVPAGQAFANVLPIAREFDRKAVLKSIVSQQGTDSSGRSAHWEFFFDLVDRRAQLAAEWKLAWDERADRYGPAQVAITVNPFPPPDSPMRIMVQDGRLLHQQLIGIWKQELARRPVLTDRFRDSNVAITELVQQGLDLASMEFSLHTDASQHGQASWIAATRYKSYSTSFA
jgi:hypothetical protein